jgi:hypothetical protein
MTTIDDFLKHDSGGGGGGGKFIGNWKKNNDGELTVWLAKGKAPFPFYSHGSYRIESYEKDNGSTVLQWRTSRFNCMEPEAVSKRQYSRNGDGLREIPPTICPDCLLIEWLRGQVNKGKASWTDKLFNFHGTDPDQDEMIIHVGGYCGDFGGELSDEDTRDLKHHGISVKEAYREVGLAKLKYLFYIVNHDQPRGIQFAVETKLLGDKMKKAIKDVARASEMARKGPRDPLTNPYPFLWKFNADEIFEKMYEVIPLTDISPSVEVADCIAMEIPSDRGVAGIGDITTHRAVLERFCVLDGVPWDKLFERAQEYEAKHRDDAAEDDFPPRYDDVAKVASAVPAGKPTEVEMVECEVCKGAMAETAMVCPHCKAEYMEVAGNVHLKSRACATCKTMLDIDMKSMSGICTACFTDHRLGIDGQWVVAVPPAPKTRRRTRG